MTIFTIPIDKIRDVIGGGGKVIRELCEVTGAKINIQDDGKVTVSAVNDEAAQDAVTRIKAIIAEPEEGVIYTAKVLDIVDFGAFVEFMPGRKGLVHISELAFERVEKVTDVLNEGDVIKVKCLGLDRGKVRLSYRSVDQVTGEEI